MWPYILFLIECKQEKFMEIQEVTISGMHQKSDVITSKTEEEEVEKEMNGRRFV